MTETHCNSSGRSSSSENTSLPDTEDDQTIAQLLAEEEKLIYGGNQQLGRRLSHLDSITFAAKISLVTSFRDTCYIEILPYDRKFHKEIWLSFWSEVHYNSLYDFGDVPARIPKKKYWLF